MKTLEILIVAIALLLAKCTVEAGTEPINTNTADGKVKVTGTGTGGVSKPFDFGDVHTDGLLLEELADVLLTSPSNTQVLSYDTADGKWKNVDAGGGSGIGTVTSITATLPIVVTPSPITTTGDISLADTAVTPGSYTSTDLTVDAQGRITAAANGGSGITPAALTDVDDTNVTLTLGGTPATALLQATSLTLGWTGTLAAARLNANVVQAVTNDTNVTGSIATQTLTLGWTGTLGISRGGWGKAMTDPNADRLTIWDDTDGDFQFVTVGTGLTYTHATHTLSATATTQTHAVTFVVDGSGSAVTTGTKSYIKIPYGGTLTGWLLIGSPSGSVTVDIFRAADGAGLPVTSIVGAGTKPSLSTAVENSSTSFTSWTSTTLTAKDNMAISLSGITATTYLALTLYYQ